MATGNTGLNITADRSFIVNVIRNRARTQVFDPPFQKFIGDRLFFEQMADITRSLIAGEPVRTGLGQELNPETQGGLVGLQIFLTELDTRKQTLDGFVQRWLTVENKLWQLQT